MNKIPDFDPNEKPVLIENDTITTSERIELLKKSIAIAKELREFSKQAFERAKRN